MSARCREANRGIREKEKLVRVIKEVGKGKVKVEVIGPQARRLEKSSTITVRKIIGMLGGEEYYNNYDDWTDENGDYKYIGNVTMMVEHGTIDETEYIYIYICIYIYIYRQYYQHIR